jgi:hypothetical protein
LAAGFRVEAQSAGNADAQGRQNGGSPVDNRPSNCHESGLDGLIGYDKNNIDQLIINMLQNVLHMASA